MQIREGRTYLDVPHQNGKISFVYPPLGRNNYINIYTQLGEAGLLQPTCAQNVSLIHSAWQNP